MIFCLFVVSVDGKILLFQSENHQEIERYDCIYYTYKKTVPLKYCRQSGSPVTLNRLFSECFNDGKKFSFQSLLEQNISPRDILQWNSSLEQVDYYASFFSNRSKTLTTTIDTFLCRCIQPGTFGKFCEYKLVDDALTFEQSIEEQFEEKRKNPWATQRYGDILCYRTLNCDSGLLCLDWRDICDGTQQCQSGYDEYNCDLLEFNECDDDEYRCMNGMCISEEFWLDGKFQLKMI